MKLEGKIGLLGGMGIVVGGVVGLGVFVFIPSIAAKTGDSIWLAILAALVVSLLGVLPLIQISSALPVAGGGYMWCSRLLSPLVGVLVSNWALFGGSCSVAVVTAGMATYFKVYYDPGLSVHMISMIFIAVFYTVFLFGLRLQTSLQVILSAQMILALLVYLAVVGIGGPGEFSASAQPGDGFLLGIALAFNVCFGFQIIAELGEEMKNPGRNIPLSLLFGSIAILVLYIGVSLSYIKVVGTDTSILDLYNTSMMDHPPLIQSAADNAGSWLVVLLLIAACGAGLTSLNAGAMALPREIFSQARDLALPKYFSAVNPSTKTPLRATTLFFAVVMLILIIGQTMDSIGVIDKYFKGNPVDFYGLMTVYGIMLLTIFVSIAAFKLPSKYPEQYQNAYFKMPKWLLYIMSSFSILSSVGFLTMLYFLETPVVFYIYLVVSLVLVAYYFYRKKSLQKQGITMGTAHDILSGETELSKPL